VEWRSFLTVLLWNMGYFDCASVCAGEVRNIGSVFPQVYFLFLKLFLNLFFYF